ncbi:MAG: TlpA disulfide reductase family protein [Thermoanaerobaculia bacterium]
MRRLLPLVVLALALPIRAAGDAVLHPVSQEEWSQVLASHEGDLVVVDFWATWCLPCLERFPKMVELSERYADRGVTFIAFSLDDRDDPGAMAMAGSFARKQGGRIEHYVTTEPIPDAFDQLDLLGIPAVKIYARDGTLATALDADDPNHQFTDEDVEEAIEELLGG